MGLFDRGRQTDGPRPKGGAQPTVAASPYEIWGQRGWANVNVVGESFHINAIRAMFGSGRLATDGTELVTQVRLVHNSANPKDRNAIEVHGASGLLGYLSREDAARYAPALDGLQQRGLVAITGARVWGQDDQDWQTHKPVFIGSVRVDLPEPHMMFPHNRPPAEAHQMLPIGSAIHVSTVDNYAEATRPYLCPAGECWVYATVHEVVDQGPRTSKQLAEVRIDRRVVGRLTPKMSTDLLPAVQFLAARGFATGVRAIVKGNQLKSEVILYVTRAGELSQQWVDALPTGTAPTDSEPASPAAVSDLAGTSAAIGAAVNVDHASSSAFDGATLAAAAMVPPAGWYPDPYRSARLRWWNGTAWGDQTAP